jgi:hypothetical protein
VCPTAQPSTRSRWRREKKVRKLQQDTCTCTERYVCSTCEGERLVDVGLRVLDGRGRVLALVVSASQKLPRHYLRGITEPHNMSAAHLVTYMDTLCRMVQAIMIATVSFCLSSTSKCAISVFSTFSVAFRSGTSRCALASLMRASMLLG